MIDIELSERDSNILDQVRERALVCRGHARYDEQGEHERPPAERPEAAEDPDPAREMGRRGEGESGTGVGADRSQRRSRSVPV